ncbi:MAG: hypothetical protein P8K08_15560 [Fuerstiella sp.]|nr:hypothetical protein [Fuerstiella sp.]
MIPNKLMTILIAGMLIGASGCSGTRLRNLITRSDYLSLEELEAQDKAAETVAAESAQSELGEQLVSSELESSEDDETPDEEKKKSWFSLAALLGRSSDDSEVSPDPFVDVDIEEMQETVTAVANDERKSAITEAAAETTEKFAATMTNMENQAEGIFDKLAAADRDAETAVDERVKLPEITPASGIPKSGQQSFADFIASRDDKRTKSSANEDQSVLSELVANPKEANPFTAEPALAAAKNTDDRSVFDRLLNETSNITDKVAAKTPVKDDFSSELFPELNELITDGDVGPSFDERLLKEAALPAADFQDPPQPQFEAQDAAADPFLIAARKHGFDKVQLEDPWAAFTKQDGSDAQDMSDHVLQPVAEPEEFAWGTQSQTPASEMLTMNETLPEIFDASPPQPVFQQVSSPDRPVRVTGGAQLSTDFSAGLTIPTLPAPQPVAYSDFDQFATTTEQTLQTDTPLAFSDSAGGDFENAFDAALISSGPEAKTGSSVTATDGWPLRTWIFLAGFAVVAYLLFAPAPQNRPRA